MCLFELSSPSYHIRSSEVTSLRNGSLLQPTPLVVDVDQIRVLTPTVLTGLEGKRTDGPNITLD